MPKNPAIDYDEIVNVRLKEGYGPVRLATTELNGTLPPCDCHAGGTDDPYGGQGAALLHPGQVIRMRRGEVTGEPTWDGGMSFGREDFELVGGPVPEAVKERAAEIVAEKAAGT